MKLLSAGVGAVLIASVGFVNVPRTVQAAPALQLPWPTGEQHRIWAGYTYGCVTHGGTGYETNHYAIDFAFSIGQNVSATVGGTVIIAAIGNNQGAGNYLAVDHGGGFVSRYLHLRATSPFAPGVGQGSVVSQGQLIGYSGDTPTVDAHLHFDLKLNGGAYKPEPMSSISGFGWYGYSAESGIGCGNNVHDPSPNWTSTPPDSITAADWGNAAGNDDFATWRPSNGVWYERGVGTVQWGVFGDLPAPGYFSSSSAARPAVYRPCENCVYPWLSYWLVEGVTVPNATAYGDWNGNGTLDSKIQWGLRGDIPVPGDYICCGYTDFAVYRPDDGGWYIRSWGGSTTQLQFGATGDVPVPGDYDGNGSTDIAVWRPCSPPCSYPFLSYWLIENTIVPGATLGDLNGNGTTDSLIQWGVRGDIPAQGDYWSDAKTEAAVWRPCAPPSQSQPCNSPYLSYVLEERSEIPGAAHGDFNGNGTIDSSLQLGLAGDVPVPGDWNFAWADETVWRLPGANWFVENTSIAGATLGDFNTNGTTDSQVQWGAQGDIPIAGSHGR